MQNTVPTVSPDTIRNVQLQNLRSATGASYTDCLKALKVHNYDTDLALAALSQLMDQKVTKLDTREARQGRVFSYVHTDGRKAAMLVLQCETDFVANTAEFQELGRNLVLQLVASPVATVEELLASPFIKDSKPIHELLDNARARMGENLVVQEFKTFHL